MVRQPECTGGRQSDHCSYEAGAGQLLQRQGGWQGVLEYRIDVGPGYRIYFGKDGDRLVILIGGGTKKRQQNDIHTAITRWKDYKQRKR